VRDVIIGAGEVTSSNQNRLHILASVVDRPVLGIFVDVSVRAQPYDTLTPIQVIVSFKRIEVPNKNIQR
jgi:hypothetical protein